MILLQPRSDWKKNSNGQESVWLRSCLSWIYCLDRIGWKEEQNCLKYRVEAFGIMNFNQKILIHLINLINYYKLLNICVLDCPICFEELAEDKMKLSCEHTFCRRCITEWLLKTATCPYCRCDSIICNLCREVARPTTMTLLCGHTFCKECIITRLEREQRCPECWCIVNAYMHEGSMVYLDIDLRLIVGLEIDQDDGSWPDAWRNPRPFVLDDYWFYFILINGVETSLILNTNIFRNNLYDMPKTYLLIWFSISMLAYVP